MARTIVTDKDVARAARSRGLAAGSKNDAMEVDTYTGRLLKYVPAEVVAVYVSIESILDASTADRNGLILLWVVAAILLLATPLYLARIAGVRKRSQLWISAAAFLVWIFALGGPFAFYGWYDSIYGAVVLPLFTFLVPILQPR